MGLRRSVNPLTALRYRGGSPFLTYILHRIGGSALFIFFVMYVLALMGAAPANAIFEHWLFQIVALAFGLFHAVNGLRITILDLSPGLIAHQRQAIKIEWAVFLLVYGFAAFAIIRATFGG